MINLLTTPLASRSDAVWQLAPIVPLEQGWQVLLVVGIALGIGAVVVRLYAADTFELPRGIALLLGGLRLLAILLVIAFVVQPQQVNVTRDIRPSRVAVLIDNSLSMGLTDAPVEQPPSQSAMNEASPRSRRIDQAEAVVIESGLIEQLRREHNVSVFGFGPSGSAEPAASLARSTAITEREPHRDDQTISARRAMLLGAATWLALAGSLVGATLLVTSLIRACAGGGQPRLAWRTVAAGGLVIASLTALAAIDCGSWPASWRDLALGRQPREFTPDHESPAHDADAESASPNALPSPPDWRAGTFQATHATTPLAPAIESIVTDSSGDRLAGLVVVSDGCHNDGSSTIAAALKARDAGVPIFTIGVGNPNPLPNVAVVEIQAPATVLPGDPFPITAAVQTTGNIPGPIEVALVSSVDGETVESIDDTQTLTPAGADEMVLVKFEARRQVVGRHRYTIRTAPPAADSDPNDNERSAVINVAQRKTKILLMAGGPNRDFQFLRNQLFRDTNVELHVWLQSARDGADQEAHVLRDAMPTSAEEWASFDAVIAFDPDWARLSSEAGAEFERWVAEQAGGLVVLAGPVNTPQWTRIGHGDEVIDRIRDLYPVVFYEQGSAALRLGRFAGEEAFPLELTPAGRAVPFLQFDGAFDQTAAAPSHVYTSTAAKNSDRPTLASVYGYYAVSEAKPGADVLAYFSDPDTAIDGRLPIYLAAQQYGAGRVVFQASAEIWRLREFDVTIAEQYYARLIRWASQGRLLRDSPRGVLLVDRTRACVGDTITVHALLRDTQGRPETASPISTVVARPDGQTQSLVLEKVRGAGKEGSYVGRFVAQWPGAYRVTLALPDSATGESLTAEARADIPDEERRNAQRNDEVLGLLAERTDGHYYTAEAAGAFASPDWIGRAIPARDVETIIVGEPDRRCQRRVMSWLLVLLTVGLAMEWSARRCWRLA